MRGLASRALPLWLTRPRPLHSPFPPRQINGKVKTATDLAHAAQKSAADVIDAKLAVIGLGGLAANATAHIQAQIASIGAAYQVGGAGRKGWGGSRG